VHGAGAPPQGARRRRCAGGVTRLAPAPPTPQPLDDLRAKGAIGVALVWSRAAPPPPDAARAVAALCAAHPGPCPVLVEVGNGGSGGGDGGGAGGGGEPPTRLRSRSLRVEVGDDLLAALREVVGAEHVHLVRTP